MLREGKKKKRKKEETLRVVTELTRRVTIRYCLFIRSFITRPFILDFERNRTIYVRGSIEKIRRCISTRKPLLPTTQELETRRIKKKEETLYPFLII